VLRPIGVVAVRAGRFFFERIMQSTGSETAATPSPAPVRRDENAVVSKFRAAVLLFLWILAIVLATTIDRPVAEWVQAHRPLDKQTTTGTYRGGNHPVWSTRLVRLPGNYVFVAAAGIAVVIFHRKQWRAALPILLSGPLVGASYVLMKWMIGRRRPVIELAPFTFHPFINGIGGLFHSVSGLAFPSGDATMAFAAATCMAAAIPKWSAAFFAWAVIVAVERVLENAHYVSDVTAGAGLGVLCALAVIHITRLLFKGSSASGFDVTTPGR
jgi:membrane-associated phospholipid phosphatase